jgi:hypothetical protein
MRRVRKILGNDRRVPIIKENRGMPPTVVKKGSSDEKLGRIIVSPDNIPVVQKRNLTMNAVNLQEEQLVRLIKCGQGKRFLLLVVGLLLEILTGLHYMVKRL